MSTSADETPFWRTIETAPRNGQFVLLCVANAGRLRSPWEPGDRHVHGHHGLVGKWQDADQNSEAKWISDLRTLDHEDGEGVWIHERIEPSHWMSLPPPPPSHGWHDSSVTVPPLKSFALICEPRIRALRMQAMVGVESDDTAAMMGMGCLINQQSNFLPLWATDLFEEALDPSFPRDIAGDAEHLAREQVTLPASYWYELPPLPVV